MSEKQPDCCLSWCDKPASDSGGLCAEHQAEMKRKGVRKRWKDALDLDPKMDARWLDE